MSSLPPSPASEPTSPTPSANMDADLKEILEALREEAYDIDEATQLRFLHAVNPSNCAHEETVDILSGQVKNISPRLALRLAIWYMHSGDLDKAVAVMAAALEYHAGGPDAGEQVPTGVIRQLSACRAVLEAIDEDLDEAKEEDHDEDQDKEGKDDKKDDEKVEVKGDEKGKEKEN
ncbi:hypothetical protein F5Y12DRAFT_794838 [Xylaria sp. FL1777]|nr:hypothetical protein F5Y12DRAFT_794838 [Xylaria sp. FL1777]